MASFKLTSNVFPDGTTVKAYPASNWPTPNLPSGEPIGAAKAEGEMKEGSLTLSGLDANTEYWAVAEVAKTYRYVLISTAQGKEVTGARKEPEKALKNLLTVLDERGEITDATTEA